MWVQCNMFILMLSEAFKSSSNPETVLLLALSVCSHILVALKRCVMEATKHTLHFKPRCSPPPFLVSNKVFAAVITRVINCTAYSSLGSWSWRCG